MGYKFYCEVCGKEIESKTDPANWKRKICFDCRNKEKEGVAKAPQSKVYSKAPQGQAPYEPKVGLNRQQFVEDILDFYELFMVEREKRNLEIADSIIGPWATSGKIAEDRLR